MARETYEAQVALLVRVLPYVAREGLFALKGGSAINLFHRDLPRLSVDIDLVYLPVKGRAESLAEISEAMDRMAASIEGDIKGANCRRIQRGGAIRFHVRSDGVEIKVETSPVARGVVRAPEVRSVTAAAERAFGFAKMQVVAFEDLFGGKLHAALDRQHPRDLFDVKLLYENEGLTDDLFHTFLVYVAGSSRPPHELLNPNLRDLDNFYTSEFAGMARAPASPGSLLEARRRLIADIQSRLDGAAGRFLLTLHDGAPDFDAINLPQAAALPAVRWKLVNLERLKAGNPAKHMAQRDELEALLSGPP